MVKFVRWLKAIWGSYRQTMIVSLNTKRTRYFGGIKHSSNIQQRFSPVKQLLLPPKPAWQLQVFLQQQLYRPKKMTIIWLRRILRGSRRATENSRLVYRPDDRFLKRGLRDKACNYKHRGRLLFTRTARRLSRRLSHHRSAKTPPSIPLWTVNQMNNLPQYRLQ